MTDFTSCVPLRVDTLWGEIAPRSTALVAALGAGSAVGWVAWHPDGAVALIALLPLLWALQRSRCAAGLLWFGYFLVGSQDMPAVVARFFPEQPWSFGILLWLLDAIILSLPWLLLWSNGHAKPRAVCVRAVVALVLFTVPPIGCLGWLSPLLAGGVLFPGWGWGGIAAVVVLYVALAWVGDTLRRNRVECLRQRMLPIVVLLLATAGANLLYQVAKPPAGWVALNTELGRFPEDRFAAFARQQALMRMSKDAINKDATLVVLPEEVAGTWRTAVAYWWAPLDEFARAHGAVVLVGADVLDSPGLVEKDAQPFTDSLVMLGAIQGKVAARVPIPIGLWRPSSNRGAAADLLGSGIIELNGRRVAVSICYEDLLAWPVLLSFAHWRKADVLISVANNWFYEGFGSLWIQRRSIELWARLFGVPLLRAVNTTP